MLNKSVELLYVQKKKLIKIRFTDVNVIFIGQSYLCNFRFITKKITDLSSAQSRLGTILKLFYYTILVSLHSSWYFGSY